MKKQDLLNFFDDESLNKLFGFCYARTNDSYEAEELCSDIVYALVKAANTDGEIENVYPFIWRVARNVYADFSNNRRKHTDTFYNGNSEDILLGVADDDISDNITELLTSVYRRIAFLTKAYREVMIMFYMDGLSTREIAQKQGTSEGAVRQRLFVAKQKIKSEVERMADTYNKPVALDKIDYVIWGSGDPIWGNPRNVCTRMFSKHVVWLCHKKPMSACEIAEELNVPTVYVEEELEILCKGENGEYGLLRRLPNHKYAINFVLLDKETIEKANELYEFHSPRICDIIIGYIEEHRNEYISFPYLNRKVDMNLILWQQILCISSVFSECVERILKEKYFSSLSEPARPFSVCGYEYNGKYCGCGCDVISAENLCGYSAVRLSNIYSANINKHFECGHNMSKDPLIQLAIQAIDGLDIATLDELEKEHAAKAVECGYIYREGHMIYTKLLVNSLKDNKDLFATSNQLANGYFDFEAEAVAKKVAKLIKESLPEHLINEWRFANLLANLPMHDAIAEHLIRKGFLTCPENGLGAEGCWMSIQK